MRSQATIILSRQASSRSSNEHFGRKTAANRFAHASWVLKQHSLGLNPHIPHSACGRSDGGVTDLCEGQVFAFVAGRRAAERLRSGMHAHGDMVAFNDIFQPIAGLDVERLANLAGDRRLPLCSLLSNATLSNLLTLFYILTYRIMHYMPLGIKGISISSNPPINFPKKLPRFCPRRRV